jgi:hypothetical protein
MFRPVTNYVFTIRIIFHHLLWRPLWAGVQKMVPIAAQFDVHFEQISPFPISPLHI